MCNKWVRHRFIVAAALAALLLTGFPFVARGDTITGNDSDGKVVIENDSFTTDFGSLSEVDNDIYGWHYTNNTDVSEGSVTIDSYTAGNDRSNASNIYGGLFGYRRCQ